MIIQLIFGICQPQRFLRRWIVSPPFYGMNGRGIEFLLCRWVDSCCASRITLNCICLTFSSLLIIWSKSVIFMWNQWIVDSMKLPLYILIWHFFALILSQSILLPISNSDFCHIRAAFYLFGQSKWPEEISYKKKLLSKKKQLFLFKVVAIELQIHTNNHFALPLIWLFFAMSIVASYGRFKISKKTTQIERAHTHIHTEKNDFKLWLKAAALFYSLSYFYIFCCCCWFCCSSTLEEFGV